MNKNFEEMLPEGYREVYHINAKDAKVGLILNLVSLVPLAVVAGIVVLIAFLTDMDMDIGGLLEFELSLIIFLVAIIVYMVAHELVHGIAYKSMTHRKLTFGLSWSCAFCGVPDIYCYRKTALVALIMPFAVFTVLLTALVVGMYFVGFIPFLLSALLLGLHIGGCSGDLYMFGLLIFKYRDNALLMRDTGPEQFIYVKD